jgi:ABC-type antimicrobial peptide transport system permease subunit
MTNLIFMLFNATVCVGLPVGLIAAIVTGAWYLATHCGWAGIVLAGFAVAASTVAILGLRQRSETCDDS